MAAPGQQSATGVSRRPLRSAGEPQGGPAPTAPAPSPVQRAQVRGLILLAALIVLAAFLRADWNALFAPGWWRLW
jgi:hypothetical protein